MADPYHFDTDTDPDPGCEKIRYGSGSRVNFDTDPDPGKNYTDPDPAKKALVPGKSSKSHQKCMIRIRILDVKKFVTDPDPG